MHMKVGFLIELLIVWSDGLWTVAVSVDSRYIVSAGKDKSIKLFGLESGEEIVTFR